MSLKNLLSLNSSFGKKQGLSEERIYAQIDNLRKRISFWREYPDLFVDEIKGPDCNFEFYTYQRVFLRVIMRHKYVYATFPRAFSKSFLSMMGLMLRAILFPGSQLFVTTGGKEQAASITMSKIDEICRLIPALNNEINWERGQSKKGKDTVTYIFKNGSKIDILAARETSRGQRRTGGLMEECVSIDQTALNEIIIPTTNVNRLLPDGTRDSKEVVNKSQIYITTAGWKNSFAYNKLIELLIQSLIEPDQVMILGGTYKIPVVEGLLDKNFVTQLQLSGTYNEDSFDREYNSIWSGDTVGSFFSSDMFDKNRILKQPEYEYSGRTSKSAYYIIGVDVGRFNCTTEAVVFKVNPQPGGNSIKSIVNIYTYDSEHFEDQAINLKKLFFKYHARVLAIDANGLGAGLVDFMVKSQVDPDTNDTLPPFGVENDEDGKYKKLKTIDTVPNAMYLIKATVEINSEAYSYTKIQMSSGKLKFLIDEAQAKADLMSTRVGQQMNIDQRNEQLKPYVMTSILREQLLNLVEKDEAGVRVNLKQSNKKVKKDKVSAMIYGLYYIYQQEQRKNKRRNFNLSELMLFSKG